MPSWIALVACNGTGATCDVNGNITGYLTIAAGNGIFAQTPVRIAQVTDGLSNTAAFSESTLGNGQAPASTPPTDPKNHVLEVTGGNDPTPVDCDSMNGTWAANRGGQWINGHFGHTLYNHFYTPNRNGWDCGNGSHNKGLVSARSFHPGGVNLLMGDGSIRFVTDSISVNPWRAMGTIQGGENPTPE